MDLKRLLPFPAKTVAMELQVIQQKIHDIRGQKVMLDFDLAALYGVETRTFNQAIKRNSNRFPEDFVFQLTRQEYASLLSKKLYIIEDQILNNNSSQNVMSSSKHRGKTYLPYAFTEHGVTMLASVLKSPKAVNMSISLVRAFIALKQYVIQQQDMTTQLREIRDRLGEHDVQISSIHSAIETLLGEKSTEKDWQDRERIGFKY
jgi:hypothetical protein